MHLFCPALYIHTYLQEDSVGRSAFYFVFLSLSQSATDEERVRERVRMYVAPDKNSLYPRF